MYKFLALLPLWMLAVSSCCREASAQISLKPEYSVGQPVVVEVKWPEVPEGAKPTDLAWSVPGSGLQVLGDSSVALWPEFGATDKQLTVKVIGALVTPDGKYVPGSLREFTATTLLRGIVLPGPAPGPGPTPGPQPPPGPAPDGEAPIKDPGFRVLITYESQLPVPRWLNDADFLELLRSVCVAGPNGVKEWRIVDKDSPSNANAGVWPGALEKMKGRPVPCILISTGKVGTIQDLPKEKADAIALIKRYAEAK